MRSKSIARTPKRFLTHIETRFRLYDSKEPWSLGTVVNLSETGLCLQAMHDAGAGDLLELIIESTDKRGYKRRRVMCAKIVWLRDGKSGLQFVKKRRQV